METEASEAEAAADSGTTPVYDGGGYADLMAQGSADQHASSDHGAAALGAAVRATRNRLGLEGKRHFLRDDDLSAEGQPPRELLSPRGDSRIQLICTVLPQSFSNAEQPYRHIGTESITVLGGALLGAFTPRGALSRRR